MDNKYKAINKAIVRTPLFPLEWLKHTDRIICSSYFLEGLFLASPLVSQLIAKAKLSTKIKNSIIKYAHRSAFRCTPFGLFAGISVAKVRADKCEVLLEDSTAYNQHMTLDIEFMRRLIELLKQDSYISHNIKYFTNESVYLINNEYHYIEYNFTNGQDVYEHSVVEKTDILDLILNKAKSGINISSLIGIIKDVDSDVSEDEALNFIKEIIESQLLKSDLEIGILDGNHLDSLINKLVIIGEKKYATQLQNIKKILNENSLGYPISYKDISIRLNHIANSFGLQEYEKKIVCVDMFKPVKSASISTHIVNSIESLLSLLVRIQPSVSNYRIKEFITAFENRYEDKEIDLTFALDNEYGIGYPIKHGESDDNSELLKDLVIPFKHEKEKFTTYNRVDSILLKKLFQCIKQKENIVYLNDKDFDGINYEGNFPPTIYVLCSILKNNNIFIKAIGGVSSANIIGRFAHSNSDIRNIIEEISTIEQNIVHNDIVLAEVAHIPDNNDGNIVCQVKARDYMIPYISNYISFSHNAIPVSDITISVVNKKIILRSKLLNKQIIPRFSNAYNYDRSQLPIVRFLYDVQCANITDSLTCKWHDFLTPLDYLPRIQYKNCVLSKQRWIFYSDDFKNYFFVEDDEFCCFLKKYIQEKGIPNEIVIVELDNELYINLEKKEDCLLLKSIIVKSSQLLVEEYIYAESESIVESDSGHYANEVVLFLKNNGNK